MTIYEKLKSAEASFAMENIFVTPECKKRAMDVIEGRRSTEDVIIELMKKHYVSKEQNER